MVKDNAGSICGFTSLMPTYEEGQPVVYCYEIHIRPELKRYVRKTLPIRCQKTI